MAAWSHEDRLNDAGTFTATFAPPENDAQARAVLAATEATKTVIVAISTDDAGITRVEFTGWVPPGGNRRSTITGTGLLGYYDRRILELTGTLTYTAADQTALTADLIGRTPGALVDYTSGVTPSGVPRDQTWTPSDGKVVGEALREIPARINGFDFALGAELDTGALVRRYRTWYPRRGGITFPAFEYGRNMLTEPQVQGNPDFATAIYALGVETNPTAHTRLVSVQRNTALLALGYPVVFQRVDRTDVTTQGGLDEVAQGALRDAAEQADTEIAFAVNPSDPTTLWGSWDLGDDCQVMIPTGRLPWWPDGLNVTRRAVAHRRTVDDESPGGRLEVVTGRKWATT